MNYNAEDYYNLGYEVGYGDKQECSTVPKSIRKSMRRASYRALYI